jgi:DNA-binding CsgD family transcriptional regulator
MIDQEIGKQIVRRLDAIVGLLVHSVTAEKTQAEKIQALSAAGFQPKEIARIIGTTPNTVRVAMSVSRKHGGKTMMRPIRRSKHDQQSEGE